MWELLCQKRSTGTFLRGSLRGSVKRGERSGEAHFTYASPRNAFAFLTPCSVFFLIIMGFRSKLCLLLRKSDQRAPPFGNPPPLKRWTKLLLLCLLCAARLFAFKCNVFSFRHHEPINRKSRYDPEGCSAEHICRKVNGKIQSRKGYEHCCWNSYDCRF